MGTETNRIVVATNTYTSDVFKKAKKFNFMHLIYTSDATVGNRRIRAAIYNSADQIVWDSHSGAVQAASVEYHYEWMPGIFRETSFIDSSIQVPFPAEMELPPNHYFKVFDATDVSASDDMVITVQYRDADGH
jgi:hypothetical protein